MFGIVRPCRHRLCGSLFSEWVAHLCGLCLTLRDLHGQNARLVTNYDALLVSVLAEAQNPEVAPHRRAGPCALRGLRRAEVVDASGTGAQLAAAVSLVLAAAKVRDHIGDKDGVFARRLVASGAGLAASRWEAAGVRVGAAAGFDVGVLTSAVRRQAEIEQTEGVTLTDITEPTETAVSAAFAHTAVLAAKPRNIEPLTLVGQNFGRIAHLLDAVEDLSADAAVSAYNPLLTTATTPSRAREHCEEALGNLRSAMAEVDLADRTLAESLLVKEVGIAVDKVFAPFERSASATMQCGRTRNQHGLLSAIGMMCPLSGLQQQPRRNEPDGPGCGDFFADCCSGCCQGCCEACEDICCDCCDL
jgi:hypothetical protein